MFSGRFLQNRKFIFIPTARLLCPSFSPRKDFGGEEELCKSIMENGISEPLTVRPAMKNKYTVVSGERRLRAARAAGLSKVPCVVLCQSDRQGGKRIHRKEIRVIHDERGEDAKRYDRRMEAKYGDSGRRGGHGERHDKHAGERQGKPFRKHAKIRKAPFRSR